MCSTNKNPVQEKKFSQPMFSVWFNFIIQLYYWPYFVHTPCRLLNTYNWRTQEKQSVHWGLNYNVTEGNQMSDLKSPNQRLTSCWPAQSLGLLQLTRTHFSGWTLHGKVVKPVTLQSSNRILILAHGGEDSHLPYLSSSVWCLLLCYLRYHHITVDEGSSDSLIHWAAVSVVVDA